MGVVLVEALLQYYATKALLKLYESSFKTVTLNL
jgi:hypothetical protein